MAVSKNGKNKSKPSEKFKSRTLWDSNVKNRIHEVEDWSRNGITKDEIAKRLDIGVATLAIYAKAHPMLAEALNTREVVDGKVERSLFQRAIGYEYKEEMHEYVVVDGEQILVGRKVFLRHMPPSDTATLAWLNNRRSSAWRQGQHLTIQDMKPAEEDPLTKSIRESIALITQGDK